MSGTRKDAPFVSSSGRVQGTKISRDNSGESLTSHPLLSPPPGSVSSANAVTTTPDNKASTLKPPDSPTNANSPKYVPYTPRHRVSTSQVTAQFSPASAGTTGGGATPQLQLQNLKAAAQNAQLNSNSVGWAICEKLYQEGESPEWEDIWSAVVQNKATLLLPLDPVTPQEVITADYVRDHVVYCTAPSNKVIPVVTLSGLRGTITENTLTLRSVIPTTAPHFQALQALTSRISALAALPPLPSPLIVPLKPEYPVFNIPAPHTELPFPSQPQHRPQARPALTAGRLNPFASLFGVKASPASSPIALPSTLTNEESEGRSPSVNVSVYVIQGRIIKKDVVKGISNSVRAEMKEALTGLPPWILERANSFTAPLLPSNGSDAKKSLPKQSSSPKVELDISDQTKASDSFQAFYFSLEEEMKQKEKEADTSEKKIERQDEIAAEERRLQTVERVERAICALFYDQLFRQKNSDDASHDEALASRIAALNMLDLGLEHLGIDVGKAKHGVQAVVTSVGRVLQGLQDPSCRAPVDKAATIVAAHNAAVEGLSKLPPIRLKPDDEIADEPTPLAAHFKQNSPAIEARSFNPPEVILSTLPEESSTDALPLPIQEVPKPLSPISPIQSPLDEGTSSPTPVASDILLPFIIYSVVKANPPELVSHLLYVERYRMRAAAGGEEGFCLINLLAVVEFLENVDLAALGLADSARVLSVADLAPLPLSPDPFGSGLSEPLSPLGAAARLRGRVNQQVEELADSANKVISGVVDSSFSALRGLLSNNTEVATSPVVTSPQQAQQAAWSYQGFGLLRRGTEFTLANLPTLHRVTTGGSRRGQNPEERGQMLLEVPSRPESVKAGYGNGSDDEQEDSDEDEDGHGDSNDDHEQASAIVNGPKSDARSVRSFASMMSGDSRRPPTVLNKSERMSISDRLANVSVRSRLGKDSNSLHAQSPPSHRISLLSVSGYNPQQPYSSRPSSPLSKISPPLEKFLNCKPGDLKISEVSELLQEYRRVVEGMRALNGFEE
ncbi:hypothetical protein CPB86DRAFT_759256 [Serendipita vermifera]|nr:hypothetical protein CPB86DRAFT_759256 [Serendipita vermifera]